MHGYIININWKCLIKLNCVNNYEGGFIKTDFIYKFLISIIHLNWNNEEHDMYNKRV